LLTGSTIDEASKASVELFRQHAHQGGFGCTVTLA